MHSVRMAGKRFLVLKSAALMTGAALLAGAMLSAAGCGSGASAAGAAARTSGQAGGGPGGQAVRGTLTVSAAISLKDAFTDLGKAFEAAHPGVSVQFNFGASGDLESQIEGGAPVDVFAAASTKETGELEQKGLIDAGSLIQPVGNDLVLAVPAGAAAHPGSFAALAAGTGKVAIGNPDTVPAGRYARDALIYFGIWDSLRPRLVYGESVRQVLDYVARNEVDAGLVYATDARARASAVKVALTAPAASHAPVTYPMAVVSGTGNHALAAAFLAYLGSAGARPVYEKYGFRWLR